MDITESLAAVIEQEPTLAGGRRNPGHFSAGD
jgi:hypothetical protein